MGIIIGSGGHYKSGGGSSKKKGKGKYGTEYNPAQSRYTEASGGGYVKEQDYDEEGNLIERGNFPTPTEKEKQDYMHEVNPEIRIAFEKKYGTGATVGVNGKGFKTNQEAVASMQQNTESPERKKGLGYIAASVIPFGMKGMPAETNKQILGTQLMNAGIAASAGLGISALGARAAAGTFGETAAADVLAGKTIISSSSAMNTGNLLSKGLGFLGTTTGKLAIGAATADQLTDWFASDNVITGASVNIGKLAAQMGAATPEQRAELIKSAEQIKHVADLAKAKIVISGIINPINWVLAEPWWIGSKVPMTQMNLDLERMKNYNPYNDTWSLESQALKEKKNLATYGKPKYDEEGNPLY